MRARRGAEDNGALDSPRETHKSPRIIPTVAVARNFSRDRSIIAPNPWSLDIVREEFVSLERHKVFLRFTCISFDGRNSVDHTGHFFIGAKYSLLRPLPCCSWLPCFPLFVVLLHK